MSTVSGRRGDVVFTGGIGFTGTLLLIFITLKLTHLIDWSWWWVLSPLWFSILLGGLLGVALVLVALAEDRSRNEVIRLRRPLSSSERTRYELMAERAQRDQIAGRTQPVLRSFDQTNGVRYYPTSKSTRRG